MQRNKLKAILLLTLTLPMLAWGQVSINGFASAGGGILFGDEIDEDDVAEGFYTENLETAPFIKFALQTKAEINSKTSVTGQFIAQGLEDFDVQAEWAYISYQATDSTDIRLGRMRAPFFMYSDYIDVGYAYPWIRAPVETYRLPITAVEGFDVVSNHGLGNWDGAFQAFYGSLNEESVINNSVTEIDLEDFGGINYVLSNDWLTLRVSYNITTFTFSTPEIAEPLFDGLTAAALRLESLGLTDNAADVNELYDILLVDDEDGSFYGGGLTIDTGSLILASEITFIDNKQQSLISNDTVWYAMAGYRFGDLTVHFTYQSQEGDPDFSVLDLIPDLGDPSLEFLRESARAAIINEVDTSATLGFRYDYGASAAFKFEIGSIEQEAEEIEGTIVSFAIDIVF